MSYYNRIAVAERDPNVPIVYLAYRAIADKVLDSALKDVTRESTRKEACSFFESGDFRLFADVLGVDHERVLQLYREYLDGTRDHLSRNRTVTGEEKNRAVQMFRDGKNVTEIAEALERSRSSIGKALRDIRQIPTRRIATKAEKRQIRDLYNEGFELHEIARMVGRSYSSVSKWAHDASVH